MTHACNLLNGHLAASLKGECAGGAAREEDQTKARGLHRGVLLLRCSPSPASPPPANPPPASPPPASPPPWSPPPASPISPS